MHSLELQAIKAILITQCGSQKQGEALLRFPSFSLR